MTFEIVMLL